MVQSFESGNISNDHHRCGQTSIYEYLAGVYKTFTSSTTNTIPTMTMTLEMLPMLSRRVLVQAALTAQYLSC